MGGIRVGRWLAGGVAAGVLIWLLEGAASVLYMQEMEAAMKAHSLSMEMGPRIVGLSVVVSLIVGLTLVFLYAAARPRFGAGPATAIKVAIALWFGGYVVSLAGYEMMELFPTKLLAMWAAVGLVEVILAALLGGAIYRES